MTLTPWDSIRQRLRSILDGEEFETWIGPLRVQSEGPMRLVLIAPNPRFLHTLEESYRPLLDRCAQELLAPGFETLFVLETEEQGAQIGLRNPTFDKKYSFETFVVGNSNQFAHAAARAVAESPSHSYNPLFLYGGVGLGKTHLLHAIGHKILRDSPHLRIMYLAAEQFVNELINSIRFDRMPEFRDRYRNIDILLIDDIQFIANKERTQEEFFHTFNTLYTSQRQIILTSDASPRKIPTLEERLRSRFQWGLIADIQPPDLETKVAILRRKADTEALALPDDVALFIARQVRSNIRELEGLLNRVTAFASLTGKSLSIDLARETLKDILPVTDRRSTAAEIIKFVARHYGLKVSEIKSRNNTRQIVFPRKVAMNLLRILTDLSYPEIGKLFNDKHHSTVISAVKDIDKLRDQDPDLDRVLQSIQDHFS
ncbi:MAG: chromosomal replication initiator protein DnaA [Deltaproteobacteria bacterium]|nr:chromosomal replication initiator protein DnaA [Deltaproteobacteria bacterium]